MITYNPILKTDSYKTSHWKQYPPGTETIYSFFESRGGQFTDVVFFGLQYILDQHLRQRINVHDVEEAEEFFKQHFGNNNAFNKEGWLRLIEKHGGIWPVKIKAVLEGTVVPTHNVLMTVENTDPEFPWVTNYLETILSQVWYPCTVATQSREMKKIIKRYMEETGCDLAGLDFKLHDFGYRGSTSEESAAIGSAAHLTQFKGTDTLAGILLLEDYYEATEMPGFSIPAAEHSTITSWGKENELDAYRNMLEQYPTGLVAVVSDSYDIFNACSELWGTELRDRVLNRDGTLVIRPDSGDPSTIVVKVLNILGDKFGSTYNRLSYRMLPPQVRVIQGDGIDIFEIEKILSAIKREGWAADNIAFGSGGGLLQKVNRDTCKFVFKCSAAKVDGQWRYVYKDPVTDPGKTSKKGRLCLVGHGGTLVTRVENELFVRGLEDQLVTVYEDGEMPHWQNLENIRKRAEV